MRIIAFLIGLLFSINGCAGISYSFAQYTLNKLTSANGMRPIKLSVVNEQRINAYGAPGYVSVTKGLLKYGNPSILISILAHELGHAKGIYSEVGADIASVTIARKAGLDVCPGAKQFLLTVGKKGGIRHPDGAIRLNRIGC